jgi:hypothetical protein
MREADGHVCAEVMQVGCINGGFALALYREPSNAAIVT